MTFKPTPLSEIAAHVGGTVEGDAGVLIRRVAPLDQAGAGDLSFLANPRYARLLATTRASAVLVEKKAPPGKSGAASAGVPPGVALVRVAQPYLAYARAVALLWRPLRPEPGVHPGASVHPAARVDPSAAVLPLAYVGADSVIGPRTVLHPGAIVLERCRIGADCILYPGVVVREDCVLGARVILHNSVSIGADGYGFAQQYGKSEGGAGSGPAGGTAGGAGSSAEGGVTHVKIPQVGNVVLEDDVEIGACTCVDRAALGSTRIGRGTKIDDLVMIGHGCQIGADCLIVAQSGLAGSAVLAARVVLGARAGVLGHLTVGAGATLMSRSHVTRSVPPGATVSGNPARPHREQLRQDAALAGYARDRASLLARLGTLVGRVERLERAAKPKRRTAKAKKKPRKAGRAARR